MRTLAPSTHARHSSAASQRGRVWTALGVALAAVGCAPPGPRAPETSVQSLRHELAVGAPLNTHISFLRSTPSSAAQAPLIVLVHGTPGEATAWADYLLQPPPGTDVLALDRPGFGHSGPPGAVPGLAEQAAAVLALLPADDRPVVLLGHSLGGPVVAWVAAQMAQEDGLRAAAGLAPRLQALVLLAASLDPAQEDIHPMQHVGAWAPVRALLPRVIRNANSELMALKPELDALVLKLPQINTKVIIMHGTKDDLVPVANVPFMQARLTGARCVKTLLLEGANHFLPWNSEAAVRDALRVALDLSC